MGGAITALDFEGCDGDYDDQCEVARGSSAKGKMTFAATGAAESLECKIYGIILGLEVPFPGGCPVVDACSVQILNFPLKIFTERISFFFQSLSAGDCPIEAGEEFVYNVEMKIENIYPPVS